jgi:hypothetical protein
MHGAKVLHCHYSRRNRSRSPWAFPFPFSTKFSPRRPNSRKVQSSSPDSVSLRWAAGARDCCVCRAVHHYLLAVWDASNRPRTAACDRSEAYLTFSSLFLFAVDTSLIQCPPVFLAESSEPRAFLAQSSIIKSKRIPKPQMRAIFLAALVAGASARISNYAMDAATACPVPKCTGQKR